MEEELCPVQDVGINYAERDRSTPENTDILSPQPSKESWRTIGPYLATLALLLIYGVVMAEVPGVRELDFFERDPTISYISSSEQIPNETLVLIVITLPLLIFVSAAFLPAKNGFVSHIIQIDIDDRASSEYKLKKRFWFLLWTVIGFCHCMFGLIVIIETLKVMTGRHRPCFLYLCDYKGYREAADTGDYSFYNSQTVANAVGSLTYCHASEKDISEAQKSWPSGHAGSSFAAMYYCVLFLRFITGQSKGLYWSNKGLLSGLPMLLAVWISLTRVQDYRHHVDDILTGGIIGSLIAYVVWRNIEIQLTQVLEGERYKRTALNLIEGPATSNRHVEDRP